MTPHEFCPISARVDLIKAGEDPGFICELPSGFAVLNANQPEAVTGCCMLLPSTVVASPNDLDSEDRARFFLDMTILGDAIMQATGSKRINYLVLCNQAPELHGHCIPRFESEDPIKRKQGPFEAYDFVASRRTDPFGQDQELLDALRESLQSSRRSASTEC